MARNAFCGSEIKKRGRIPERSEVWNARKREDKADNVSDANKLVKREMQRKSMSG
jgi:hypothetical protein